MGIKSPKPKDPWPDGEPELPRVSDEALMVRRYRYKQARKAGLSFAEAELFAGSDADLGVLRQLVRDGCSPELIARILI